MRAGTPDDVVDHAHEAHVRAVLQAHDVQPFGRGALALLDGDAARRQQALGLQLFATQAHDHHLTTKVGVEADIAQRAYGHRCLGCVDGHAAAIGVFQPHHVVDVGVERQQFAADALHGDIDHTGHALHGGGDGQQIARAHRAIGVAVALEGVARQRGRLGRPHGRHGQALKAARLGHVEQALVDPGALRDVAFGVAYGHAITQHRRAGGNVGQCHFVGLGNGGAQHYARKERGARRQAAFVGHDGHVVGGVHAQDDGFHGLLGKIRRPGR